MVVGGSLTVISLYILRRKLKDHPRPYQAIGYPIFPALFVLAGFFVLVIKVKEAIEGSQEAWLSLLGLIFVLLVYIVHFLKEKYTHQLRDQN